MSIHLDEKNIEENTQKLLLENVPILHFDRQETTYPCSVHDYVESSILFDGSRNPSGPPDMSMDKLQYCQANASLLTTRPDIRHGSGGKSLSDIPVYGKYQRINDREYRLLYTFFYGYQTAYPICGSACGGKCNAGQHWADIEHVSLYFIDNQLDRVYFAAHGSKQGTWRNASKCDITTLNDSTTHVNVYVARHSHASYPKNGSYCRILGIASDYCDTEYGMVWIPTNVVVMKENDEWNRYQGFMGFPDHVSVPANQGFWDNENNKSANFCWRCCCCCCW